MPAQRHTPHIPPAAAADHRPHLLRAVRMAESDFMAYGSIEMIFACLVAFWVALQVLQTTV